MTQKGSATRNWLVVPALLGALALGGCAGGQTTAVSTLPAPASVVQPGPPGEGGRALPEGERGTVRLLHTEADVRFMQHMIVHHLQAIEMSRLVPGRTERPEIHRIAERIDRSQDDEIRLMSRWLLDRGAELPDTAGPAHALAVAHGTHDAHAAHGGHHDHGAAPMPGMLTGEQMRELEAARGDAFDRLFLRFMVLHHEGAIEMVEELFASPGAAQDTDIFRFASHVDADQRMEIARMLNLLRTIPPGGG